MTETQPTTYEPVKSEKAAPGFMSRLHGLSASSLAELLTYLRSSLTLPSMPIVINWKHVSVYR
jgi:hypothetical protein